MALKKQVSGAKKTIKAVSSAAKAVKKFVQKSKPKTKVAPVKTVEQKLRSKRVFSLRALPIKKSATIIDVLNAMENDRAKVDALKKPNEVWAFEIGKSKNKSYQIFPNARLAARSLRNYKDVMDLGRSHGEYAERLIESIKLVKFKGEIAKGGQFKGKVNLNKAAKDYTKKIKNPQIAERVELETKFVASKKEVKKQKSTVKKKETVIKKKEGIISKVTKKLIASNKENAKLKRELAKLKGAKKSGSTKKAATKKQGTKPPTKATKQPGEKSQRTTKTTAKKSPAKHSNKKSAPVVKRATKQVSKPAVKKAKSNGSNRSKKTGNTNKSTKRK